MFNEVAREVLDLGVNGYLRLFLKKSPSKQPQVLYAGQAGSSGEIITGGRVKLLELSKTYPEQSLVGNILYLVTSGLPKGAVQWARACRQKGIKVVINQNGVAYPAWAGSQEMTRINRRNRQLLELADLIIYQSQFCKQAVEKWVGQVDRKNVVLHNPVDTERFKPVLVPQEQGLRLLLMGSHRHRERVEVAIHALGLLHKKGTPAHLHVAGPLAWLGARQEMQGLVSSLGLDNHVEFSGSYLQTEAPQLYQSARILIHLQDKDASPTVPLEALACGLQVVAPKSGGLPEIIPADSGVLLGVKEDWESFCLPSAQAVAQAVERLQANEPRDRGRDWVLSRFSSTGWVREHSKLFRDLLNG